jgi:hypothetical protein
MSVPDIRDLPWPGILIRRLVPGDFELRRYQIVYAFADPLSWFKIHFRTFHKQKKPPPAGAGRGLECLYIFEWRVHRPFEALSIAPYIALLKVREHPG